MQLKRVVVTGIGAVTPLGNNVNDYWNNLINGVSGAAPITRFDASKFKTQFACEVKGFDIGEYLDRKEARKMDRFSHFAVVCAQMAVKDAELKITEHNAHDIGIIVGSAMGGIPLAETQHSVFLEKGLKRVSPYLNSSLFPGAAASQISIALGIKGFSNTIAGACSTGNDAIGYAYQCIRYGLLDICLVGGAEAPLAPLTLGSFDIIHALSTQNDPPEKASRPFDGTRNGFVLSEGAGIIVMEELGNALRRNAKIYGEVLGYYSNLDAFHMVQPAPDGEAGIQCVKRALIDAGIHPDAIDYINAHGTSTPFNDKNETKVIKNVFGERAYKIPISANKSMTGHALGAAGAIEAIASLLTLKYQFLPPTINHETPDPECDLDYVPNRGREAEVHTILSNSYGFGGKNSEIIFRSFN